MTTPQLSPIPRHPSQFACIDLINSGFTYHLGMEPGFDRLPLREWRAWFASRYQIEVDCAARGRFACGIPKRRDHGVPLAGCMRQDRLNAPYKPPIIYLAAAG